jgi:NAD(P)-dependent dehydrogenase (short-subunit alcohol dehydrogenase family)
MEFRMRLPGKVAIVTGAGQGIGRATAELLSQEGAKVVVADVDPKGGGETARAIQEKGHLAHFVEADISREADAKKISDEAVKVFGGIDILINNAAIFVLRGCDATAEEWQRSLGVNVIGTALVTKYAVEELKKRGGAIVNLGSVSSFAAQSDYLTYSATKAAIVQMTRNMAMDLGPYKIRVNSVCPHRSFFPAYEKIGDDPGAIQRRGRRQGLSGKSWPAPRSCLSNPVPCLGGGELYHRIFPDGRWRIYGAVVLDGKISDGE